VCRVQRIGKSELHDYTKQLAIIEEASVRGRQWSAVHCSIQAISNTIGTERSWIISNRVDLDVTVASSSPTWHTVFDIIGDLLTNRCQVEKLLFYRRVLGRFGKLPKLYRFVPKIISPIHATNDFSKARKVVLDKPLSTPA
jgi:hypothetical protein